MATTPKGIYYPNNYNEIADIPEDMKKMAESIEEVFEDTDSDLSDIKEEQTTQNNRLNSLEVDNTTNKSDILTNKQEINNIKTEQTEQNTNISTNATNIESLQEENENLKKIVSQLPQVPGQGTSITLENTIEAQFTKFDVEGNSVQDGTPSPDNEVPIYSAGDNENLVNESNINFTYSSVNKVIYDNGLIKTINSPNGQFYEFDEPLQSGETYTLTFKFVQGRVNVQGSQDFSIGMYHSGNNNSWQGNLTKTQIANIDLAGKTFTLTHKATDTITGLYIFIYSSPTFVTPLWFNVKVEKGNKASGYSPYGMGSINEKIQTRNLVDGVLDNSSSTTAKLITKDMNVLVPTGTYTISFTNKPSQSNGNIYSGSTNILNIPWYSDKKTFTLTEPTLITRITCDVGANQIVYAQLEPGSTASPYVEHQEQDYSIFVQQPMRSIGDVRDCFVKKSDGWYERHLPYIASYNGETLPQDVYNEVDNVKYCNEKSMSTTGQFSIGASVQYIDENNWNDLPCTETQIQQLENLPSTYKEMTIINSEDETPAYLEVAGIYDLNKLITRTEVLESEV